MKPHLCVDARMIGVSGHGTLLKSSLAALSNSKKFRLTLLGYKQDQALLTLYEADTIWMKSAIYSLSEQIELPRKIPKCTLFWSPHFNIPLLPIRAKKRVTTICDVYHLAHLSFLSLSQKVYARTLYNAAFLLSNEILTISSFSEQEIQKFAYFKPKKLTVVSPDLDFVPVAAPKKEFLLAVGNLKPHKNLSRLVQAYARLKPPNPLVIVGKREGLKSADQSLFQEVEKDPFLKNNVHFLGVVSEQKLKELYAQAFLFIYPSIYEGFGYPPLEAMASSCPVLASRAASIPEVCAEAVEYIDPYSVDSIAEGLRRLLQNEKRREELIQKGRSLVEKKRAEKNQFVEVIDACCSGA